MMYPLRIFASSVSYRSLRNLKETHRPCRFRMNPLHRIFFILFLALVSAQETCPCSNVSIGVDSLSGTLNGPGTMDNCSSVACTYEIDPNPELRLMLFRDEVVRGPSCFPLDLYYMGYVSGSKEKIYLTNLTIDPRSELFLPVNVGLHLRLEAENCSDLHFHYSFKRYPGGKSPETSCPLPFLTANDSIQTIDTYSWPDVGCSFRLTAKYPINLQLQCEEGSKLDILGRSPGEKEELWSHTDIDKYFEVSRIPSTDLTLVARTSDRGRRTCNITYSTPSEAECDCNRSLTLSPNQQYSITSPGFPVLRCGAARCLYTFRRKESTVPDRHKNAFVLTLQHFAQSPRDFIVVYSPENETISGAFKKRFLSVGRTQEREDIVLHTSTFFLNYTANMAHSDRQGFNMTIKVVDVPPECYCPTPDSVQHDQGSFSLTVPGHCPEMECRLVIKYPQDDREEYPRFTGFVPSKFIKFKLNTSLQQKHEYLRFFINNHAQPIDGEGYYQLYNLTNFDVEVAYKRTHTDLDETRLSSFKLTWEWIYKLDCTCGESERTALVNQWQDIYSPRFPEGDKCGKPCSYTIQAPKGYHVRLNVIFLGSPRNCYEINLFDGSNTTGKLIRSIQGQRYFLTGMSVQGRTTYIRQNFSSMCDSYFRQGGYAISYVAEKDPEPRGFFEDVFTIAKRLLYKEPKEYGCLFCFLKS